MREVIRQKLWLGTTADRRDVAQLHDRAISAVVDLAYEEPPASLPREITCCRFPLLDGSGNDPQLLGVVIQVTASLIRRQIPTLVSCSGGMSRSPAIAAAALALVGDVSPDGTLQGLVADVPHDVSPSLWSDVKVACYELKARRDESSC